MCAEVVQFKLKKSPKFEPILKDPNDPKTAIPYFSRHIPTGIIYYQRTFKKLGIPKLHISTGEKTLGKAKSKAEIMVQQHINQYLGINDSNIFGRRTRPAVIFKEIAEDVLRLYTPTQRPKTQEKHRQFINELIGKWGAYDPNKITPSTFDLWISDLRKEKRFRKMPNGKLSGPYYRKSFEDFSKHMNLVMRWGYEKMKACTHLVTFDNPDKALIHSRKGRVYTEEELERLWDAMNPNTQDQYLLSYECMMRLREGLKLTWDRFDVQTGKVTLRPEDVKTGSKTGKGREFYLSPLAHERLKARWEKRNPKSPYVFPSPRNPMKPVSHNKTAWRLAKERVGIKGKATWHHLRHSAITHALLKEKRDQKQVGRYAGVSLQTIDRVYLHTTAEDTSDIRTALSVKKLKDQEERYERGTNGNEPNS